MTRAFDTGSYNNRQKSETEAGEANGAQGGGPSGPRSSQWIPPISKFDQQGVPSKDIITRQILLCICVRWILGIDSDPIPNPCRTRVMHLTLIDSIPNSVYAYPQPAIDSSPIDAQTSYKLIPYRDFGLGIFGIWRLQLLVIAIWSDRTCRDPAPYHSLAHD